MIPAEGHRFPIPIVSTLITMVPTRTHIGQHINVDPSSLQRDRVLQIPLVDPELNRAVPDIVPSDKNQLKAPKPPKRIDELELGHLSPLKLRHVREVINLSQFIEATTLRTQAKLLDDYLRSGEIETRCTLQELAVVLGLKNAESFRHQIIAESHLTHKDGRPTLIHPEAEAFLNKLFIERYTRKDSISIHETLDLLLDKFGLAVSLDTFRHYLLRKKEFKIATGKAIDNKRAEVEYKDIKNWYNELKEIIKTVPREFIFNVDESGCDEYVDAKDLSVIVPDGHKGLEVEIPVHRQTKRATLTACISADGSTLKPFVILPRETIDEEIYRAGYTPDKIIFFHHCHSFMTKRIFEYWMNNVFFPEIDTRRARFNYFGRTILLLDQFSGHNYENLEEECRIHNVQLIYLVPHTSHLCQPLDLITFSDLKRNFNNIRCSDCRSPQSNKIIRMMRAWQRSISIDTIVSTFAAAGIVSQRVAYNQRYYCTVDLSVSIHLKDIDDHIVLRDQLFGETSDADRSDQTGQHTAPCLSLHRGYLYPPSAPWVNDPQTRYPLSKMAEEPKKVKKTRKPSSETAIAHPQAEVSHTQAPMMQLTLFERGVNWQSKVVSAGDTMVSGPIQPRILDATTKPS